MGDLSMETEEKGFEPLNPLRDYLFSKQTHSTTLPLFPMNQHKLLQP